MDWNTFFEIGILIFLFDLIVEMKKLREGILGKEEKPKKKIHMVSLHDQILMKKLITAEFIGILILTGCSQSSLEGKTMQQWRDGYYDKDTAMVNLYNCVNESKNNPIGIQSCLDQTPLP